MPVYQYGTTAIHWEFREEPELKHHYVTVERGQPVLLRGPAVSDDDKVTLIRNRARWIRERLKDVNRPLKDTYVTRQSPALPGTLVLLPRDPGAGTTQGHHQLQPQPIPDSVTGRGQPVTSALGRRQGGVFP